MYNYVLELARELCCANNRLACEERTQNVVKLVLLAAQTLARAHVDHAETRAGPWSQQLQVCITT